MRRREFVVLGASLISAAGGCKPLNQDFNGPEFAQLRRDFPYEFIEVPGARAWEEWSRLRQVGRGWPVIVGGEEDFLRIAEGVGGYVGDPQGVRSVEEILDAAQRLDHPASFFEFVQHQYGDDAPQAVLGDWPESAPVGAGLTVPFDILTGQPYERVYIVVLPTQDPAEAPAYLRWGGWNECPAPEQHVAAFRSWRERYGVVPVAMAGDVLNLVATSRPSSRDEALDLAREQYAYCTDIVDQGVQTLSNLAATLSERDWWYFWWD